MTGRISLLVSHDMRVLVEAVRGMDAEVRKQIRAHTKAQAAAVWKSEIAQHTGTRLQNRVLVDSARISVTDQNVMMKSAIVGKLSSGVPVTQLAGPAEFGSAPGKRVTQSSGRGPRKQYSRRMGGAFGRPTRKGKVFFPAAHESIPRLASLWMQTAYRTVAETFEKAER